ncbi:mechanosensitive ion channel [bacterium]|nr:mechanosensitive ion channel [bacterium]
MESYLIDLSSLLLLGVLLGCHYLAFRTPARGILGRSVQRAGKLRMLGASVLGPLSLFLWLEGHSPLLTLVVNQVLLYWLGSTVIEVAWLLRRAHSEHLPVKWNWRPPLRLLWMGSLMLHAGWDEPQYRDLAYSLAATLLVALVLLRLHRAVFGRQHQKGSWTDKLQRRLSGHGYLIITITSGYYLLRAWTVVPITSAHLHGVEKLMWLLLGLAAVEMAASSLEHVLLSRRRSEEMAHLAADGLRATLYCTLALVLSSQITDKDVTSLAVSSAFFSVGLGFALKPTLGNFVSGLIQRLSQDYFIGDFVHIGPIFGLVTHIDWRTVSLGTLTKDTITIPHSQVAHSLLINYTRPNPKHASYLELKLSRHIPPGMVRRQLLEILETIPEVCKQPEPEVYLMDLDGYANTYRIRWWIHHINDRFRHESIVHTRLMYGLERRSLRPVQPVRLLQLED